MRIAHAVRWPAPLAILASMAACNSAPDPQRVCGKVFEIGQSSDPKERMHVDDQPLLFSKERIEQAKTACVAAAASMMTNSEAAWKDCGTCVMKATSPRDIEKGCGACPPGFIVYSKMAGQ